jgi:glycine cleavage system H protein
MAFVAACELPEDLWFQVEQDVWLRAEPDGLVQVGMTDPAQTRAGKILHVRVRTGKRVEAGKSLATVESGKWVGPVPAPLAGLVAESNPLVMSDPDIINRDPYGDGWLLRFRPDAGPERWREYGLRHGLDAVEPYRVKLAREHLTCLRCADPPSPT